MTKQTANNNSFLKEVKTKMNKPIYTNVLAIVNGSGEEAAREWLQQFFCVPVENIFPR